MAKKLLISEEKKDRVHKDKLEEDGGKPVAENSQIGTNGFIDLQHLVGNRAVQRLIVQSRGDTFASVDISIDSGFELDDETAGRINQARGGGQPLDSTVQQQMGDSFGQDFSGVRVHSSPEADDLNHQLSARAFTTGQDIFFREGAYNPNSSGGQQLIAHELTHVVQQTTGAVSSDGAGMTVNPPGDSFEHEADHVASTLGAAGVQRQVEEEEEEPVQMQEMPEDEEEATF